MAKGATVWVSSIAVTDHGLSEGPRFRSAGSAWATPEKGVDMEVLIQCLDEIEDLVVGFALWVGTWPRMIVVGGFAIYFAGVSFLMFA